MRSDGTDVRRVTTSPFSVAPGDEGMAEYNTATMVAKEIEVESPEVED